MHTKFGTEKPEGNKPHGRPSIDGRIL